MSKMKVFIIMLMTVLIVISILLMAGYFVIGYYFYNIALSPTTSKAFVLGEDFDELQSQEKKGLEKADWLSLSSKDTYIIASNNGNLKLHAYEIVNPVYSDIWTIVIHGYSEIEDCGYTSILDEFDMLLKDLFNLPSFPVLNAASSVCKIKAGYKIEEGSAIEQVKKSKTPTLFIHGEKDRFVPFEMLDELYEAANCSKEKLIIKGAAHAESASVNPELYWKTIDMFIEENL